ncbi:MAG: hypothetical protein MUF01_05965 [Bryobacterales bacterium]|jgi:hypothetical protein|nr:hypothetical protein [Bryobacterales bacterium]
MNEELIARQQELVARILGSDAFHKSTRSRQLLEYLSGRHFSGTGEAIHETTIGEELFGRGADFDPSADSIVRASMRQLRQRLLDYYAADGAGEAWDLQIPKGEYRLCFAPRNPATSSSGQLAGGDGTSIAAIEADGAMDVPERRSPTASQSYWPRVRFALTAVAMLTAAFLAGSHWGPEGRNQATTPSVVVRAVQPQESIMEDFLTRTRGKVEFVPSDSIVNLIQSYTGEAVEFREYQTREAFAPDHPAGRRHPTHWRNMVSRELMNIGDASLTLRAALDFPQFASRIAFRQSRDLQARDLRSGNFVFLGSMHANPWVAVFEAAMNFQIERPAYGRPARWRNRSPNEGEHLYYPPEPEPSDQERTHSHALVALTPNLARSGYVLLVGGVTQPDTEAAGEFMLAPGSARTVAEALAVANVAEVPGFEVLLRTQRVGNTWRVSDVLAQRAHPTLVAGAQPANVEARRSRSASASGAAGPRTR